MTEIIGALLVLVVVAATVFVVFAILRAIVGAFQRRQRNYLDDDSGISLLLPSDRRDGDGIASKVDRGFDDLVAQTGLRLSTGQALGIMALCAVVFGGLPILLRNDWVLSAIGVLAGILIPMAVFGIYRVQHRWVVLNQLPDAFFLMARSLRSGLNIEQSMGTVATYGTEPIASEFKRVCDQTELGLAVPVALQGMARRIDLPDFNAMVTAVTLHRTVGGNLALLLERVAAAARDRISFRGYFRAATALARITGFAIAMAPIILLVVYAIWQPDFIERFTSSVLGMRLLVTAAVLEIVGAIWMLSLLRVDY